jgi:hypothetical protein
VTITVSSEAALKGLVSLAGANATLKIYTAPQPAGGASPTGTQLGLVTLGNPIGTITSDSTHWILTFGSSTPDNDADSSGTADWARISTSGGAWICDLDVGTSGTAIIMDNTSVQQHGIISITSGVIKVPKTPNL